MVSCFGKSSSCIAALVYPRHLNFAVFLKAFALFCRPFTNSSKPFFIHSEAQIDKAAWNFSLCLETLGVWTGRITLCMKEEMASRNKSWLHSVIYNPEPSLVRPSHIQFLEPWISLFFLPLRVINRLNTSQPLAVILSIVRQRFPRSPVQEYELEAWTIAYVYPNND